MSFRILCVGSVCLDTVVRLGAGSFPGPEELVRVPSLINAVGGCCGNSATALARLGAAEVCMAALVGDDAAGFLALSSLAKADVTGAMVRPGGATAHSVVLVGPDERSFLYRPGVNEDLRLDECLSVLRSRPFDALLVTDPFLTHVGRTGLAELLSEARGRGAVTALDLCWDPAGRWAEFTDGCWPHVDLALANLEEARMVTGAGDAGQCASSLCRAGASTAVIKMGADGLLVRSHGEVWHVAAQKVECQDPTGAGDWCNAGVVMGYLATGSAHAAARLGSLAGASAVGTLGGSTATPLPELRTSLARYLIAFEEGSL
ncbi:carbohydrate kinase family protein [Streptomyces sp. NPDC051636]|uniref:carbohydrate kinase family protein n=1 Tax=Streptomyces sp. NPDC051636 TaxID=3365663 RepID=UPI0037AB9226